MDDKRTDKVSTAPGDVERLAKALEWKVDKDACANSNSHADYIEWQAAATLLALSAEVERLKVFVKQCADGDGFNLTARARAALGE